MSKLKDSAIVRPGETSSKGFDRVFAFLREQFLAGKIQPGDRLIPERELCLRLGVSRPVLREALRALSMLGVVDIMHGVGTVVRRPDVSILGEFFTFALAQQPELADDVMEARTAIECQAIRLACKRAVLTDLERLRAAFIDIGATIDDASTGAEADYEFHNALVQASHSPTLISLYNAMGPLLHRFHQERRIDVRSIADLKAIVARDHARIFDAVVSGDPVQADAILRNHFTLGDEYRLRAATKKITP